MQISLFAECGRTKWPTVGVYRGVKAVPSAASGRPWPIHIRPIHSRPVHSWLRSSQSTSTYISRSLSHVDTTTPSSWLHKRSDSWPPPVSWLEEDKRNFGTAAANPLEASPFMAAVVPLIPLPSPFPGAEYLRGHQVEGSTVTAWGWTGLSTDGKLDPSLVLQQRPRWTAEADAVSSTALGRPRPTYSRPVHSWLQSSHLFRCHLGRPRPILHPWPRSSHLPWPLLPRGTSHRDGRDQSAQGQSIHGLGRPTHSNSTTSFLIDLILGPALFGA
ncbi:hypothetical protein IWZ01DRAFT_123922 [Phyllosticta capitalensis]